MKYLAAYLLLNAGGNAAPSNDDIKTLLASVGVEAEDSRVASLLSAVEGKDVNEVRIRHRNWISTFCTHQKKLTLCLLCTVDC